jgi:hypothetical protein
MVTGNDGKGPADQDLESMAVVSPLSGNNDDTGVVNVNVVDHHRDAIVRYENSFRRFQAVRDDFAGQFGDRQIEEAVTYIQGNPRSSIMSSVTPKNHLGTQNIEMAVENAVIDALVGLHQHGHEYNVNNKSIAAAALDVLPEAAHKLNSVNLRNYILLGLRFKEMDEVFGVGALTNLPVPQSDTKLAGWIPETYFSDFEISTLFLSALEATQQDPAWYSRINENLFLAIENTGDYIGQYVQRASNWLSNKGSSTTRAGRFRARGSQTRLEKYTRVGAIGALAVAAIGTVGIVSYEVSPTARGKINQAASVASLVYNVGTDWASEKAGKARDWATGKKATEWDVEMYGALTAEGTQDEQNKAVWDVIERSTCQVAPIKILAGNTTQAAKDLCRPFGGYAGCKTIVEPDLIAAAGGKTEIEGNYDITCPTGDSK